MALDFCFWGDFKKHFLKFTYLFWKKEREHEQGRGRERERETQEYSTLTAQSLVGLKLVNCEIMTWAKIKSPMLNWLSHSATPFGNFLITDSISLLVICSSFLILLFSVLVVYMCLGIYRFLLGCLICWHIVFLIVSYDCVSAVLVVISPFSFEVLFIWVLSVFFFLIFLI